MADGDVVVDGAVVFAAALPAGGAVMHVFVEDVTHADAASRIAAQLDVPLVGAVARGEAVPFRLNVGPVDTDRQYTVRVHVDRSANGRVETGDHVSTQSHPVLTRGAPASTDITVYPLAAA